MAMTLATAQAHLDAAIAAELDALKVSSYSVGSRSKTNQQLSELRASIAYWQRVVDVLTAQAAGNTQPSFAQPRWT